MIPGRVIESEYRRAFRMAIPDDIQHMLAATCGDRAEVVGDYKGINTSIDYPCSTGIALESVAAGAAILRDDRDLVPQLRLCIAYIETSLGNLMLHFKDMRDGLRAIAQKQP